MNPPIPPPVPTPETEPPPRVVKPRPPLLSAVSVITMLFTLCGYLFIAPEKGFVSVQLGAVTVWVAFKAVTTWFFWNGHNWARIVILICAASSLFNLATFSSSSELQKVIIVLDLLDSLFLIYWLNTRPVRDYFKR